jgi:hypothetical protein
MFAMVPVLAVPLPNALRIQIRPMTVQLESVRKE